MGKTQVGCQTTSLADQQFRQIMISFILLDGVEHRIHIQKLCKISGLSGHLNAIGIRGFTFLHQWIELNSRYCMERATNHRQVELGTENDHLVIPVEIAADSC
jgi:hypothetical protein